MLPTTAFGKRAAIPTVLLETYLFGKRASIYPRYRRCDTMSESWTRISRVLVPSRSRELLQTFKLCTNLLLIIMLAYTIKSNRNKLKLDLCKKNHVINFLFIVKSLLYLDNNYHQVTNTYWVDRTPVQNNRRHRVNVQILISSSDNNISMAYFKRFKILKIKAFSMQFL